MDQMSELAVSIRDVGAGDPVVILPGMFGIESRFPVCDEIFRDSRVLTFTHPGYSGTKRPLWCNSVEDLAYAYMEEIEKRELRNVTLVGFSLGGWVACEIAVRRPPWLSRVLLIDSLGVRAGAVTDRSFADVFATAFDRVRADAFCDAEAPDRYLANATEEDRMDIAFGQEALAAYGWKPYLHSSKLPRRLSRVNVPVAVLWGNDDKIADIGNGKLLAASIPGASFQEIPEAGHHPHIDNPRMFNECVRRFLREGTDAASQEATAQ